MKWSQAFSSPSLRYSVLGRVLELQDRDQWTSPASFFFVAKSRERLYSQKQRRFDGRSPACLTGSASTSGEGDKTRTIFKEKHTQIQRQHSNSTV